MILEVQVFVDPALLRVELPELVLRPGMTLAARVAERSGSRGILMLAGNPLSAELPDQVKAGEKLRLRVMEVSAERIVMKLVDESAQLPQQTPTVVPMPLPDGRLAHFYTNEREGDGRRSGEQAAVAITYRSPSLGAIDFRLAIEGGALTVGVKAMRGRPHELAQQQADLLREALARASGRSVQLAVTARDDPIDVYA
ncbi:MAG: hypothetical protein ACXVRH_09620 [Thermoleophilaceae bacterium]